jgi:hypothetical protein
MLNLIIFRSDVKNKIDTYVQKLQLSAINQPVHKLIRHDEEIVTKIIFVLNIASC